VKKTMCLIAFVFLAAMVATAQDYPRVELFTGYTYTRANSASDVPAFSANGGSGQFAINANKWMGFVMDIGAVHNGNIGGNHLDSTFTNYLFGPRLSLRYSRVRPYFNILFGGMHAGTSIAFSGVPVATPAIYPPGSNTPLPPNAPVTGRLVASQTSFAMTTGGGLDIKISRHVSFRPIGLDYLMTRMQNFRSAQDNNQHNIRYTTGFNFTLGGEAPAPPPPPPPPPMKACWDGSSVPVASECAKRTMDLKAPAGVELCPGTTLKITPPGAPPNGADFQWSINGEPVSKESNFEFGTTGRQPGTYKVGLKVSAPEYNDATVERVVSVAEYRPPTGALGATPQEIWAGERATLSARFTPGNCGGDLQAPTYSASEGSVIGNQFDSSSVVFDPASTTEQRKSVTLVARVADQKGQATAQTTLVVKKAAPLMAKRYPDIIFPANSARVNNCGKRVLLEELRAAMDADPTGHVVLVGHLSEKEAAKTGLDQLRALNGAAVISAGSGICAAFPAPQIFIGASGAVDNGVDLKSNFCGTTQETPGSRVNEKDTDAPYRRIEVWFVPTNGALPASLKDQKDAASLSVSKLGCPR